MEENFLRSELGYMKPILRPIAEQDYQAHIALGKNIYRGMIQVGRSFRPIHMWHQVVDQLTRNDKSSRANLEAKCKANQMISLDEEGFVDISELLLALHDIDRRRYRKRKETKVFADAFVEASPQSLICA